MNATSVPTITAQFLWKDGGFLHPEHGFVTKFNPEEIKGLATPMGRLQSLIAHTPPESFDTVVLPAIHGRTRELSRNLSQVKISWQGVAGVVDHSVNVTMPTKALYGAMDDVMRGARAALPGV